jgi:nicotinamide-nucleotide amidase
VGSKESELEIWYVIGLSNYYRPFDVYRSSMANTIKDQAAHIIKLARKRHMTVATVESCTAGSLAHLLSQAEGAADTLHGGFIVYTKENKTAAVGVPKELLAAHTAVSAEVAQAMAQGGLSRCPADFVVSITGVAGPEPDEDGNPVGLVYVAVAARDGRMQVARHDFGKCSKDEICAAAIGTALALLEELLTVQVS